MSLGAPTCDALGVCASGTCPPGMDKVSPPVRNEKYSIRTGDGDAAADLTEYVPGEIMDIHIRTLDYNGKYIGLLIYAVEYDEDGQLDEHGCPSPGCDGSDEIHAGSWYAAPGEPFQQSQICGDKALTHTSAVLKNFHHTLHWRAPPAGTGKVIFRAIVKVGPTNGGWFYWPMMVDLVLEEGVAASNGLMWLHGESGRSCKETCRDENLECDEGSLSGDYNDFKSSFVCPFPLMSGCGSDSKAAVWSDEDGDCFTQSESCVGGTTRCGATVTGGERFCPCKEQLLTRSLPQPQTEESSTSDDWTYWVYLCVPIIVGAIFGICFALGLVWMCSKPEPKKPLIEDLYMDIAAVEN